MPRFTISRDDEHLTLTLPLDGRILSAGCPLFALALLCLTALGLLSLVHDAQVHPVYHDGAFFHPHGNHVGFLWVVALLLLLVLLPVYLVRTNRSRLVFCLDRSRGLFLRNGQPVTVLRRIEQARVRTTRDPDGACLYGLFIIYADGHEMPIHHSYDEMEIWILAHEIGDFAGVPVTDG